MCCLHFKMFSASGGLRPPDPLTRGFAPVPHWGLRPQTPVIGSRSRARHDRQRSGSFYVRTGSLVFIPGVSHFSGARDSRRFSFLDSRELKRRHSRRKAGTSHRQLVVK